MKSASSFSWTSFWRGVAGVVALLVVWELFARSGLFSQALSPPLEAIGASLFQLFADGSMVRNASSTLGRVLVGLFLACLIGIPLGILMARYRAWSASGCRSCRC
jgi:ABC-type nitrate/sulfonate/bicarbonate transport system permease component